MGGTKNSTLVSFEVGSPLFVGENAPFSNEILGGRETHPSRFDSAHESPYANRYDCMPAHDYSGDNSSLKDILELVSKRLSNLETKRYFPSPEFE